ncbi:MAG: MFS transporter, partial [Phycisphaerales bacterium]|nr:MFS transporter [Phycisphaerales bacterium]
TYHGDIRYPFYAAGSLCILNWLYGMFVLPESLAKDKRAHFRLARANPVRVFAGIGHYPLVAGLIASVFVMNLAQFGLHATWVLYTGYRYEWSELDVGLSLAFVGVGAAIVQGGLARKIIPALGPGVVGEKRALILGGFLGVFSFLGYGLATEGWMIYVIITIGSLGGIAQPAFQALITRSVRADEQGRVQGALQGTNSVSQIGGPLIATTVFAWFISERAPMHLPGASFLLGAVLMGVGLAIAWGVMRRHLVEAAEGPGEKPVLDPEGEVEAGASAL